MSKYLTISLALVSLVLGIGIGYTLTPEYWMEDPEMSTMDFGKADKNVDLRYINAMIAHHKSAMTLAEQVEDETKRTEIKNLANMILKNEPVLIDELYDWKEEWYEDTREVEASDVPNLGNYDEKLDLRFLNALIAHHEAGIEMVEEIQTKSSRNDILNNANDLHSFFEESLIELKELRANWYNI